MGKQNIVFLTSHANKYKNSNLEVNKGKVKITLVILLKFNGYSQKILNIIKTPLQLLEK